MWPYKGGEKWKNDTLFTGPEWYQDQGAHLTSYNDFIADVAAPAEIAINNNS